MSRSRIIYHPHHSNKKKRFSRRKTRFFIVAVCVLACSAAILYLLRLPYWRITNISITGEKTINEVFVTKTVEETLAGTTAYILPRAQIFLVDAKSLAENLKNKFPLAEFIDVKKVYPRTLAIAIQERTFWGIFCNGLIDDISNFPSSASSTPVEKSVLPEMISCAYIDKNGFAYTQAPSSSGTLIMKIRSDIPEVLLSSQVVDSHLMETISLIADVMSYIVGEPATGFEFFSNVPSEIRVVTSRGYRIIVKKDDDFGEVAKILKMVLDREIGARRARLSYIDMRFGNKVFYKSR